MQSFLKQTYIISCLLAVLPGAISAVAQEKQNDRPQVVLKTSKGDIVIELFEDEAPNTVANFVSLIEKGYYDGLTFHRVIDGFVAQGGCPNCDGTGGPGYHIPCECKRENAVKHARGSLSMAHAGKDTGGSQFFLCYDALQHLDGKHTVFGQVVKGMDVADKLNRTGRGTPADKIQEAKVLRKRNHEYKPTTLK